MFSEIHFLSISLLFSATGLDPLVILAHLKVTAEKAKKAGFSERAIPQPSEDEIRKFYLFMSHECNI